MALLTGGIKVAGMIRKRYYVPDEQPRRRKSATPKRAAQWSDTKRSGYVAISVGKGDKQLTRYVGPAQEAVLEVMKAWFTARGWTYADVAKALGVPAPRGAVLIRQQMSGNVALPEADAELWGSRLGRTKRERQAIIDLLVIANAHGRMLELLGGWQAVVDRLGRDLGVAL